MGGWTMQDTLMMTGTPSFLATTTFQHPKSGDGQILYYFIGLENLGYGAVNILQPVLAWEEGWNLASWACCPRNISTTSHTISGLEEGQIVKASIERIGASTWKIDSTVNGETTTLQPRVGSYTYNWADVTLEIYSISSCDQYSDGKVHFTDMKLTGDRGESVTPEWTQPGGSECNGEVDILDPSNIDIYHNGGSGPSPAPPAPPAPTPHPSGQCHAISAPATDDWCNANCHAGYCPSNLCQCDNVVV